jgi:prolipoprotein diacylglyceryltransferase
MLPILQIGPLALPLPALLLLAGFWLGLDLTEKQAERFGANSGQIYNMTLAAVVAGIVGARLGYAAQSPQAFLQSPLSLLALTPQMLDASAGLLAAAGVALLYMWRKRLPLWQTVDAITTLLAVLGVSLGLAHLASGDAFGAPARLPWSIDLWGELRHPSQVYEILAALWIAIIVWPGARAARYTLQHPGFRWWIFTALSAGARLVLETFRGDSLLWMDTFRQAQIAAWVVLAISLWQLGRRMGSRFTSMEQQEP